MSEQDYLESLGNRIKSIRKEKKITQQEMAKKLSTYHTTIGRIERGETNPTVGTLLKICDVLGIRVSELMNFD